METSEENVLALWPQLKQLDETPGFDISLSFETIKHVEYLLIVWDQKINRC